MAWYGEGMDTVTINKKEYRALRAAKERLEALFNVKTHKPTPRVQRESFADLVGVLSDVEEFKGKTSVGVQHMIRNLWHEKRS